MKNKLKDKKHYKLIIIGSGPAGFTASIYAARANLNPLLITGKDVGGQIMKTHLLENWPGTPNINGSDFVDNLFKQVSLLSIKVVYEEIIKVDFHSKPFKVYSRNNTYTSDTLILATGCNPKLLQKPKLKKFIGKGVSFCATCDGYFYKNKNIVLVGGGNAALTEAIYLSNIVKKVFLVHYKDTFKADKYLQKQLIKKINEQKIQMFLNYEINKIYTFNKVKIIGVGIKSNTCKKLIDLKVSGIFLAIGSIPATKIFEKYINLNKFGYIKIFVDKSNNFFTQTNISGIFAAGDVTNINSHYRQAITAAASGCMAALDCEKYLYINNYN